MTDDQNQTSARLTGEQFALAMFALNESKRSIENQRTELDKLRDRALSQLGFTGAIATFMIGSVLNSVEHRGAEFYWWSVAVSGAGVVALWMAYRVWRTVSNWHDKVAGSIIIEDYAANAVTFDRMAFLIGLYDKAQGVNREILNNKRDALKSATYSVGVLLLLVLAAMWRLV